MQDEYKVVVDLCPPWSVDVKNSRNVIYRKFLFESPILLEWRIKRAKKKAEKVKALYEANNASE
jgi:hypothetical protein